MSRAAVFVDRDGTLIEESGYLNELSRLIFYPFTVDAVRQLNRGGFVVIVITNQAGIARGIVPESFVETAHGHIQVRMAAGGAHIHAFYHCPHHPDGIVPALRIKMRVPQAAAWFTPSRRRGPRPGPGAFIHDR